MAQVPYNPVPSVESREAPVGPVRIDANPNMFGAAVGSALSQFGAVTDHSADEVTQRANAMQQIDNEARARDAQAKNLDAQSNLLNQFQTKLGADASPEALAQYRQQANDLRTQFRGALASPDAQRMYDSESISFLGRTYMAAGSHSAQQLKSYAMHSSQAVLDNTANTALQNPQDSLGFAQSLETTKQEALNSSRLAGNASGSPEEQAYVNSAVSKLSAARIEGFTRTNPIQAKKYLDEALSAGALRGQDIGPITQKVQSGLMTSGAKTIADGIGDGSSLSLGRGTVPLDRAADAIGGIESGGNYNLIGRTQVTSGQYAGQRALGKYGVMPGNLPQWLSEAGQPAMSPMEFLKNSAAQDAVFASQFGKLMRTYGNANDAASAWLTGKPMAQAGTTADGNGTTAPSYVRQFNANLAKLTPLQEKTAVARDEASKMDPTLPLLGDAAQQRVEQQHFEQARIDNEAARQAQNTIDTNLASIQGKTVPGGFDSWVNSDPKLSQLYQGLPGAKQLQVQASYNKQITTDNIMSPAREAQRQQLTGLATTDPEKFLDTNFHDADLTQDDRKTLIGVRSKMLAGSTQEPHVHVALGILGQDMAAAGITNTKDTAQDYQQFVGALSEQMRQFQADKGRQPAPDDIRKIGATLMTKRYTGSGFLGTGYFRSQEAPYAMAPDDGMMARLKAANPGLTDDQLRQIYVGMVYNRVSKNGQ